MEPRTWRRYWLGALGVLLALLAACGGSDAAETSAGNGEDVVVSDDETSTDDQTPTDDTEVETTDAPEDPVEEETADDTAVELRDPTAPVAADAVYDPDAEPILASFSPFEPGTYRTGALGTPMSFTATEALSTQPNGDGMFVITDISSRAPDDRDLVFIRVGAFSDPTAPNTSIETQTPWPNDDFLGWLDNLHEDVIATEPIETTVNGLSAIRVDLSISDDIECGWLPGLCAGLLTNNGGEIKGMNKGASYRVWIVEQGEEDPLAIVDGIAREEDAPWFARSEAVMATIAFGDIEPNPVQWLDPGPTALHVLGGVEVVVPDNIAELTNGRPRLVHRWTGRHFSYLPVTESPGAIFFGDQPHDFAGTPITSPDDLVALLTEQGAALTELDPITLDGVDTRVFDVTTTDVSKIMFKFSPLDLAERFFGWDAPAAGRIWMIDHPDRGLMTISTHAFENVDVMLPQVSELGEAIVGSMTFTG